MLPIPPVYKVEDRSVLLPHYKRFLVDPVLPHLPARLSPNSITHAGHFLCLAAMLVLYPSPRPWTMAASALLLLLYLWCDNADGAHARRTGQASTAGEYLDHGLDLVNCVYIGVVSAAALDLDGHTRGLAMASIIACASATTIWEQAVTGVFRLGMLNQIESMIFLTAVMFIDAVFGVELLESVTVFGLSLMSCIWFFVCFSVAFGILRNVLRVGAAKKSVVPALALFGCLGAIWAAHAEGALATVVAYALCATSILAFGARMLRARIFAADPGALVTWMLAATAMTVLASSRLLSASSGDVVGVAVAAALGTFAAVNAFVIARRATSPSPSPAAVEPPRAAG